MEVRPGYKLTEVGVIPEEWACTAIASVARLESGHTPSKKRQNYWGGSVQWVSLHDTAALEGREIEVTAKTITEDGLNHSSARLLPPGTVVFSRTATVGKATVMATSMATSQDFANYICGSSLHNHFLVYLFRSMRPTWQRLMAGSIHNTIYMPTFRALKIVFPPLAEQRAIAEAEAVGDADLAAKLFDQETYDVVQTCAVDGMCQTAWLSVITLVPQHPPQLQRAIKDRMFQLQQQKNTKHGHQR